MAEEEIEKSEGMSKQEEVLSDIKAFFELNRKEIGKVGKEGERVVQIDFNEFSEHSPELADFLIQKPEEIVQLLEVGLEELEWAPNNARARFTSITATQEMKIRNIRSKNLSNLIGIEGIVRQASEVRPQVTNAKFECPSCGTIISVLQIDKKFKEPSRCSCGRRGGFKELSKDMVDAQVLVIEEASDNLVGGEQPKRMTIFLKEDLVDPRMEIRTTPGSRVKIIGILKEIALSNASGGILTRFDLAVEANNIVPLEESFEDIKVSEEEEREIRELAADPELMDKMVRSIAPSIWGHKDEKRALALQLFGGVKKFRSDGTAMRGDIHMLLVGDPGVAKSVMLGFISSVAPKARYVSGKSASGAGLTATVVKDEFLKGWSLEAGAIVLANKGIICIDEFDKMDEEDRSSMHEAMEQQTVTISKATVQATLRAQTSVLAAANPKFGRFDPTQSIPKQVNLVPSLLSRFDAIFIMRDIPSRDRDTAIAMHVLAEHKQNVKHDVISKDLLKKYVSFSKMKYNPELTDEAINEMKEFYVNLRNLPQLGDSPNQAIAIGARQLEALVRLAEANARMRLSKKVEKVDALLSIDVVKSYLMQVGYDEETKTFDIDKIGGNPASGRNKISVVRDAITELEESLGKLIPLEEVEKKLDGKLKVEEIDEAIGKLLKAGDLFRPKRGYIQKM
ncbi:minichromosome maintenance protein MCM [archaeon]|jgi:replicative DNA helicase Mcm|nr:minichromosome maintenance protein MCM [archaeon]MBT6606610.1 minichromosome maintenance protein MCM [archaeon]MBT7251853.1 minichromosome maintenance protein MCM [archaeon]MBT7661123.1 minichromosome maintenance protein MCM [archaeon]